VILYPRFGNLLIHPDYLRGALNNMAFGRFGNFYSPVFGINGFCSAIDFPIEDLAEKLEAFLGIAGGEFPPADWVGWRVCSAKTRGGPQAASCFLVIISERRDGAEQAKNQQAKFDGLGGCDG